MREIEYALRSNPTSILVIAPLEKVGSRFREIVRDVYVNTGVDALVWICTQIPASSIRREIPSEIRNFWIIDTVSRDGKHADENVSCCELANYPALLSEIEKACKKFGRCVVVYDSLNAALSYTSPETLAKVLRGLNARMSESGNTIVYFMAEGAEDQKVEKSMQTLMDVVVRIGETLSIFSGTLRSLPFWEEWRSTSWRSLFSLEKPLLYFLLLTLVVINAFLTIVLVRVVIYP